MHGSNAGVWFLLLSSILKQEWMDGRRNAGLGQSVSGGPVPSGLPASWFRGLELSQSLLKPPARECSGGGWVLPGFGGGRATEEPLCPDIGASVACRASCTWPQSTQHMRQAQSSCRSRGVALHLPGKQSLM